MVSPPARRLQVTNSFRPTAFVSTVREMGSRRRGRFSRGPLVLPVIGGDEAASRIPEDGDMQLTHDGEHVLPEAHFVLGTMVRLVQTLVDGPADVLDERAE